MNPEPDRIAAQTNNAVAAFGKVSGLLIFKAGPGYVRGGTRAARTALTTVKGQKTALHPFVCAMMRRGKDAGLSVSKTPSSNKQERDTWYITMKIPGCVK